MKTTPLFFIQVRKSLFLIAFISLSLFTACKKDDDEVPPAADFTGTYLVTDDDDDTYTMKIEKKGGNAYAVHNFGDFMNIPIEATASGTTLTIPTQTFKNASGKELILSGSGTLTQDQLLMQYSVSGFTQFEGELTAKRQ